MAISKDFKILSVSVQAFPDKDSPQVNPDFRADAWIIKVDTGVVEYSFDGLNVHGLLYADKDFQLAQDGFDIGKVWFRSTSMTPTSFRVWLWQRQR